MNDKVEGKLVRQGKRIMVELPTKNGKALFAIPESAKRFRDDDAKEGTLAEVTRDNVNRIVEVTIPGCKPVAPVVTQPKGDQRRTNRSGTNDRNFNPQQRGSQSPGVRELAKASPEIIGGAFTNPYTFIQFDSEPFDRRGKRNRTEPTLLSQDEIDPPGARFTGVLYLSVKTLTPLMSCDPAAKESLSNGHKVLRALTIEEDVIVPATGVRGALRTLMTIITGGTLGYVDPTAYLIQGRDAKLGPATQNDRLGRVPKRSFLGEVILPGSSHRPGKIRLGTTKLVRATDLLQTLRHTSYKLDRRPNAKPLWFALSPDGKATNPGEQQSAERPWRLRLSGPPVGGSKMEEKKREALFNPNGEIIEIAAEKWVEYQGRNAGGVRSELRKGDLVWLEPTEDARLADRTIAGQADIQSLQWSRWGKTGEKLEARIPGHLHPDSWNSDGKVDEVTNLFGQIRDKRSMDNAVTFAARIRPENLVFENAASVCAKTVLAPMAMPHPGCLAFYRDNASPDDVGFDDWLRGYKVYRTATETGDQAPWHYSVQGVYDNGQLKRPEQQAVNQTVELLPAGRVGRLKIAYRGLTRSELALLVRTCELSWRLGGGKPLGLGACEVTLNYAIEENGTKRTIDELMGADWRSEVGDLESRIKKWEASQKPVPNMRYPRGIKGNSRGGHAWFSTHARPRMVSAGDDGTREKGLAPVYIGDKLKQKAEQSGVGFDAVQPMISGQVLPHFDPDQWQTDLLYGYDMVPVTEHGRQNIVNDFVPLADDASNMGNYPKGENQSQNRFTRGENKNRRND